MEYVISAWRDVHDNAVKQAGPGDWNWLAEQLSRYDQTDDKHSVFLFNLSRFDAIKQMTGMFVEDGVKGTWLHQRVGTNIVEVNGLVIDYDNESLLQPLWTMNEVAKRFQQYTFLIYSSHSFWKNHPAVERFRLVLPFSKPMPIRSIQEDWLPYVPAMKAFIGYEEPQELPEQMWYYHEESSTPVKRDKPAVDKQSFNPVQGYYLPSCPVGRKVLYRRNEGEFLDALSFNRAEVKIYEPITSDLPDNLIRGGDGVVLRSTFDVLSYLKTSSLYIRPLTAGKHQIICPWHHEHTKAPMSGAVLLPGRSSQLPVMYCQHNHEVSTWKLIKQLGDDAIRPYCVTKAVDDFSEDVFKTLQRHRDRETSPEASARKILLDDLFPGFQEEPVQPYSREKRADLIRKHCLKKRFTKKQNIMLLYAFEGFGKSYYANLMVTEQKRKVLFASL